MSVLLHNRSAKPDFSCSPSNLKIHEFCLPQQHCEQARLILRVNEIAVEVWCLEDLIPKSKNSSSSFEKQKALGEFNRQLSPSSLLIAFGTAAAPKIDFAGNVVVGCKVFVYNAVTGNESNFATHEKMGQIVCSSTSTLILDKTIQDSFVKAEKRLLSPPNNPTSNPKIYADPSLVSVGVVNIDTNHEYAKTDKQALERFEKLESEFETMSVETTHGLIRLSADSPFLYVSGIANTVGKFDEHVRAKPYAQNFVASHNAAVCVAWMIPPLCELLHLLR